MNAKPWRADNAHVWEIGGILCAPVRLVAVCKDQETAEQIAREHNAHAGLVGALRDCTLYAGPHNVIARNALRGLYNEPR